MGLKVDNMSTVSADAAVPGRMRGILVRLVGAFAGLVQVRSRFGFSAMLRCAAAQLCGRLCGLVVAQVVWLDVGEVLATAASAPGFCFREVSAAELVEHARDPENDLDAEMAARAGDGRNICFAAFDGDRLAAYGWYARHSIEAEHCFGFGLALPPDVVYMYKGFTHPDYRGQRLHGIAMGLALQHLSHDGIRALISTVDWTNEASLRSCARSGYRQIGQLIRWKLGRWEPQFSTACLRARAVKLIRPAPDAVRLTIV